MSVYFSAKFTDPPFESDWMLMLLLSAIISGHLVWRIFKIIPFQKLEITPGTDR
jgi:hypothetical protein